MEWLTSSFLSSFYQTQENLGSNGALCPLSDGAGSLLQLFHFHWCVCVRTLCCSVTHCDLMDCSLRGSSIHGIFQARILKWIAISFSRWSSWPRDWTLISWVSCNEGDSLSLYHFGNLVFLVTQPLSRNSERVSSLVEKILLSCRKFQGFRSPVSGTGVRD